MLYAIGIASNSVFKKTERRLKKATRNMPARTPIRLFYSFRHRPELDNNEIAVRSSRPFGTNIRLSSPTARVEPK